MREFKFRAWHPEEKRMWSDVIVGDGEVLVYCEHIAQYRPLKYEKEPPVVMQYTGLKDMNGTEIYEGDIVEIYPPHGVYEKTIAEIVYSERRASFMVKVDRMTRIPICNVIPTSLGLVDPPINLKVIGNIYENPELLNRS